jgi:hypothetical protein
MNLSSAINVKTITLLGTLLSATPALADDDKEDAKKGGEDHADAEIKEGGKFTLFGRECKAEDAGLETTPGSPPLDVDDPGTPGCNAWEINIVTSGEFGKTQSWETPLFDINYGIGDNVQLKFEVPYGFSKTDGVSDSGVGLAEIGVKYRFYDSEAAGLDIAVYPQVEFAIPGTAIADTDEGNGMLTKLPVLVSKRLVETSKGDVMLTANAGYNRPSTSMTEPYLSASLGIGFPLMKKVAMMVEGSTEQAFTKNMEDVREHYFKANLGLFGPITDHVLWFGSVGQTFASSDEGDSSHTCAVLGLRVLAGGP